MDRASPSTLTSLLWVFGGAAMGAAIVGGTAWQYLYPQLQCGRSTQTSMARCSKSTAAAGESPNKPIEYLANSQPRCEATRCTPSSASAPTTACESGSTLPGTAIHHHHPVVSVGASSNGSGSSAGSGSASSMGGGTGFSSCSSPLCATPYGSRSTRSGVPSAPCDFADLTKDEKRFLIAEGLDNCQHLHFLGIGAFSVVDAVLVTLYSGRTLLAARKVLKHLGPQEDLTRNLYREAHGLMALGGCPSAVQLYGFLSDDLNKRYEILMTLAEQTLDWELVVASTLRKLAGRESCELLLPAHSVEAVLGAALGAAAVLHAKGLANLDFKPENMLLTAAETGLARYVVSDMGLTAEVEGEGVLSWWGGTWPFRSPEMEAMVAWVREETDRREAWAAGVEPPPHSMPGPPPLTTAVDVFSIGALALSCAAFGADSRGLAACLRSRQLPPYVPAALGGLILQLTDPDPRKRPTAKEALRRLEQL